MLIISLVGFLSESLLFALGGGGTTSADGGDDANRFVDYSSPARCCNGEMPDSGRPEPPVLRSIFEYSSRISAYLPSSLFLILIQFGFPLWRFFIFFFNLISSSDLP